MYLYNEKVEHNLLFLEALKDIKDILEYKKSDKDNEENKFNISIYELTNTQPDGSVVIKADFDNELDVIQSLCVYNNNFYNLQNKDHIVKSYNYHKLFKGIIEKKNTTLKKAISWYIENEKKRNLLGLLLIDSDKKTILNPLHFICAMAYINDGQIYDIFDKNKTYTAIYYIKDNDFFEERKEKELRNMPKSFQNQIKDVFTKGTLRLAQHIKDFDFSLQSEDKNIKNDNIESFLMRTIFEYKSSDLKSTLAYYREIKNIGLDKNIYNIIPTGILNSSGTIFPFYGTIMSYRERKECAYRGSSIVSPFYSINVSNNNIQYEKDKYFYVSINNIINQDNILAYGNREEHPTTFYNSASNVCVGDVLNSNTQNYQKLYQLNMKSAYHYDVMNIGGILFMEYSIAFSLKLWRKYYETR